MSLPLNLDWLTKTLATAKCPEDLFAVNVQGSYKELAKVAHPDAGGSTEVFQKLQQWYALAKAKMQAGTYGNRNALTQPVTIETKTYKFNLTDRIGSGEKCNIYGGMDQGNNLIAAKIPRSPANNPLLDREYATLHYLRTEARTKDLQAMCHLPKLPQSFMIPVGAANKRILVFPWLTGFYSMAKLIDLFPAGLDIRDAAWIFNRILGALLISSQAGIVHGAVLPQHVMLSPKTHNAILIDWSYAVKKGEKLSKISAEDSQWYPAEVHQKKPVGLSSDIYMAATCFIRLTGNYWNDAPAKIRGVIKGCLLSQKYRTADPWEVLHDFKAVLEVYYGPRKFRELKIPTAATTT